MKNNTTELVFILDRSGSMAGLESDTTGGFNSMINKQRAQEGKCFVSTFLFDHTTEILHDRISIDKINPMTEKDYFVRGSTALLDAIGTAVNHIGMIHKYARREDIPENTIFVITTDGMENASCKYSREEVKRLIENQKEKYGWEFIFLGANIDAVETAAGFGIDKSRAVNYHPDAQGTACLYNTVSEAVCNVRMNGKMKDDWSKELNKDYKERNRGR